MIKSAELKEYTVDKVLTGQLTVEEAASDIISASTIRRAVKQVKEQGQVKEHVKSTGRPQKLTDEAKQYLLAYLKQQPATYQDELVEIVSQYFNIQVSQSTISRFLASEGYTFKKMSRRDATRDEFLRLDYIINIAQYSPDQLVFADESHVNQRTNMRPYGWSKRGQRAIEYRIMLRGERYSLLPALTVNGIIAPWAFHGSVTSALFLMWIKDHLLPDMNPFPGPCSVLVLDNCRTHKKDEIRQAVEDAGCKLIFLPPYSPDFNPIEMAFAAIKKKLKRQPATHVYDLIRVCYDAVTPQHAAAYFRGAGYENMGRAEPLRELR
ncbi:hypothetical protein CF326_g7034 [Tilletia indica]|uniref:Tc1-like transposase DDE domain-containing protein n=1 Tax=Tilletia indica TaxID=43049 RepID=A0A177T1Y2_9BASI|nr:hypothetical protein CF326_g7034 [Tilletia indica]KAE8243881.1 hypothetical protein A4X13_0g6910 [Tilletia indica]